MAMPARLSQVLRGVKEDFKQRLPGYHKSRRGGLATLTGVMLETRSANLMELAAALPREIGSKEQRGRAPRHHGFSDTPQARGWPSAQLL